MSDMREKIKKRMSAERYTKKCAKSVTAESSDANDMARSREKGERPRTKERRKRKRKKRREAICSEIRGTRSKGCPPPDKRYGWIFTADGLANDFVTLLPVKMNAIILTN